MLRKIVIACDSFKGSVSSAELTRHLSAVLPVEFPDMQVTGTIISDGGEGFTEALLATGGGRMVRTSAHNPLMEQIEASYGILNDGATAVIETAQASGLTLIAPPLRHPMLTTTYGTGELIRDALNRGCTRIILGVGGSATNDAGFGMMHALGVRFINKQNKTVHPCGGNLTDITAIDTDGLIPQLKQIPLTVACDVTNPMYGPEGAAYLYAPQKGATPEEVVCLDQALRHAARLIEQTTGTDISQIRGAGAAGGLGGCCLAMLNGYLCSGIDTLLETIRFDRLIDGAALVITGEGRLDRQTVMGKAPAGILHAAQKQNIPVVAIGGSIDWCPELQQAGFAGIFTTLPAPVRPKKAMEKTYTLQNIASTVVQIIHFYNRTHQ